MFGRRLSRQEDYLWREVVFWGGCGRNLSNWWLSLEKPLMKQGTEQLLLGILLDELRLGGNVGKEKNYTCGAWKRTENCSP